MKRLVLFGYLLGGLAAAACAPTQGIQFAPAPHPVYLTQPAHTLQTALLEPVVVFLDERTMIWINAVTIQQRALDYETGGCGHVAEQRGDAFYVDSIMPPMGNVVYTPWDAKFTCQTSEIPIHWHPNIREDMCEPSSGDAGKWNQPFVANLMVCGLGVDSVIAYRVRREVARGKGK